MSRPGFFRQQEAFDYIDTTAVNCRPFVREFASSRQFFAMEYGEIWQLIEGTPVNRRHIYEIIREMMTCKLFFDIEFKRVSNQSKDGSLAMSIFYDLLIRFISKYTRVQAKKEDFLELDSSSPQKFSRHVIWAGNNEFNFQDSTVLKVFVHQFMREVEQGVLGESGPLFCFKDTGEKTSIIDGCVYSRNRHFRLFLSSKAGENDRILKISPENVFPPKGVQPGQSPDEAFFLASLVLNVDDRLRTLSFHDLPFLESSMPTQLHHQSQPPTAMNHSANRVANSREEFNHSFPRWVEFLTNILLHPATMYPGARFDIRDVPMFYPNRSSRSILVNFEGYRYCGNVQRHHRSNNVYLVFNFYPDHAKWYQKCHDPDCRSYRSPEQFLPSDVCDEIMVNLFSH